MPSSTADGSVVIEVKMDVSDAEKELARLKSSVVKMETDLKIKGNEKIALQKQLEDANKQLEELQKKTQMMGGSFKFDPGVIDTMSELKGFISSTEAEIGKIDAEVARANIKLEATKKTYGEIETAARQLQAEQKQTADSSSRWAESIKDVPRVLGEALQSIPGRIVGALKQIPAAVMSALSKSVGLIKTGLSKALTAAKSVGASILSAVKNMNVFSKLSDSIGSKLTRLGGMIRRVFVFSVITKGLRAVRDQMSVYLNANAAFVAATQRVKGALLTAFQPIYEVVVPALTTLMNVLARAIAIITQFTAALFGKTAKQAQANAKALNEQAEATSAAGGAAEDASKQLANFDEINKLSDTSGGGGGGASVEPGPLFDFEYEDMPFDSWGEAFSNFLDNLLAGVENLKKVFSAFAAWLNDFSKKLYDMFTFPGVLEKVQLLGTNLAVALNGLVAQINWYQLGQALGAGLNLALQFLVNFLYTFDWIGLGMSLAALINGAVSEIDWYAFGQLLWAGFKIAIETLAGILLGLDTSQIIAAAQRMALGFVQSINETLDSIDWNLLGEKLAGLFTAVLMFLFTAIGTFDWAGAISSLFASISGFINGVDWAALAKTMSDNTISALLGIAHGIQNVDWVQFTLDLYGAVKAWFTNVDWDGLVSALAELIGSMLGGAAAVVITWVSSLFSDMWATIKDNFTENGKFTWEGFKDGLLNAILGIGTWVYEHIFQPFIDGFCAAFGIASPSTVMAEMGGYLIEGLYKGITDIIANIGAWLHEHIYTPIVDGIKSVFGIVGDASSVMAEIGGNLIRGLFNGLSDIGNRILGWGGDFIDWVCNVFGTHSPSTEFETIGGYLMAGLQIGVTENTEPVVYAFSALFSAVTALCTQNMDLMQISINALLIYFMTQFIVEWEKGWFSAYQSSNANINLIIAGINNMTNAMASGVSRMIGYLNQLEAKLRVVLALMGAVGAGGGAGASGYSGSSGARMAAMPAIAQADIPHLARGAVIPPNREFMAVLGDQKRGTNIETPESLMRNIIREEMGRSQTASLLQAILAAIKEGQVIEVDRVPFGQVVRQAYNEETRRIGVSFANVLQA